MTRMAPKNCNFCAKTPAALAVELPVLGRKKRAPTPYCLQCYYTTSAVRRENIAIIDQSEHQAQLPGIQKLFSECFLELQQELQEESARAFSQQKKDPLAMLAAPKRRKTKGPAPDRIQKQQGKANDGGFLRAISLPEKLKRTQEAQERLQQEQLTRMNQAAVAARKASRATGIAQRRKGSGKSIWNLAMGNSNVGTVSYKDADQNVHAATCTCGSKDVQSFGNITSRNQEVRKGEIWGTDRGDEVIHRYQCNKCGKSWNEVE